jgi:hypothetical protein
MGRLVAIILGGAAIALYLPILLPDMLGKVSELWQRVLPDPWYGRVLASGAGLLAGIGLVLLAVRGRE